MQGVSINLFVKTKIKKLKGELGKVFSIIFYLEKRNEKYDFKRKLY